MAQNKIIRRFGLSALCLMVLAGCTPSPLYFSSSKRPGTGGEIPRDGRGEPIWSAIRPAEPYAVPPPPNAPPTAPVAAPAPAPATR